MKVRVRAYGFIAKRLGGDEVFELHEGATLADLLTKVSERLGAFDLTQELILVDGKAAKPDTPLRGGAEVRILPTIVGG